MSVMWVFVISFLVFCLAVAGMASGIWLSGRRIRSSCGGLARLPGMDHGCDGCTRTCDKDREQA